MVNVPGIPSITEIAFLTGWQSLGTFGRTFRAYTDDTGFCAVGTVKARNAAMLAARIPGAVTAVYAREGDRVAKGKLLVVLEATETAAGAAGAKAGVVEAERGLEEARARERLADVTFERYRKLFAEQAVTRQEFDGRQTEKEVAVQGVAQAEARLAQAREGSRAAGTLAGYTRVIAPISGIVTAKTVDVGMTVFPGAQLLTVEEMEFVWILLLPPPAMAELIAPL